MELGEKIKVARLAIKMSQIDLAKAIGVTPRAIQYYESGTKQPKNATTVIKLAKALGVGTDYFMSTEQLEMANKQDEFLETAKEMYGSRGKAQAQLLLNRTAALFAGGDLEEEDQENFMRAMTEIYFEAKEKAHKRYSPKQYLEDEKL